MSSVTYPSPDSHEGEKVLAVGTDPPLQIHADSLDACPPHSGCLLADSMARGPDQEGFSTLFPVATVDYSRAVGSCKMVVSSIASLQEFRRGRA